MRRVHIHRYIYCASANGPNVKPLRYNYYTAMLEHVVIKKAEVAFTSASVARPLQLVNGRIIRFGAITRGNPVTDH